MANAKLTRSDIIDLIKDRAERERLGIWNVNSEDEKAFRETLNEFYQNNGQEEYRLTLVHATRDKACEESAKELLREMKDAIESGEVYSPVYKEMDRESDEREAGIEEEENKELKENDAEYGEEEEDGPCEDPFLNASFGPGRMV